MVLRRSQADPDPGQGAASTSAATASAAAAAATAAAAAAATAADAAAGALLARAPGEHGGVLARCPGTQTALRLLIPHPSPLPGRQPWRRQGQRGQKQPEQGSFSRKLCQTRVAPGDLLPPRRLLGPVLYRGERGRGVRQELESGGGGQGGGAAGERDTSNSTLELVGFLPFVL